jgi:hypothetical protein
MLNELGEFFGNIIIFLYILTVLNYFVKLINNKYRKIIVKNHKLFGYLTVIFILLHFAIQFSQHGLNNTGVIAAGILLLQVGIGIYGSKAKKRGRTWLMIHRTITVVLLIAIAVHIE